MNRLNREQIDEVIARYRVQSAISAVLKLLKKDEAAQMWALRDWAEEPIWDEEEIEIREALDKTLELVGCLEVISVASGCIPELPHPLSEQLATILQAKSVKAFYQQHFPTALPVLFSARLEPERGSPKTGFLNFQRAAARESKTDAENRNAGIILSFLEIDRRFSRGKALGVFLSLLDEFSYDGDFDLDELLKLLDDPDEFARRVLRRKGSSLKRQALQGLEDFLEFCVDIERLLTRLEDRPLLRAAIWLNYGYWFGTGGKGVRRASHRLQNQLSQWTPRLRTEGLDVAALIAIGDMAETLNSLTEWEKYASPLVLVARPLLNQWEVNLTATSGGGRVVQKARKAGSRRKAKGRKRRWTEESSE